MKQYIAARAFIVHKGKVLVIREAETYEGGTNHGTYDMPGGKVKPGEHIEDALIRETEEESGLKIEVGRPFYVDEWRPVIDEEEIQIIGVYFECSIVGDPEVALSYDHDDYQWIPLDDPNSVDLIETNLRAWQEYLTRNI